MRDASAELAAFAVALAWDGVPAPAREAARTYLLDSLGVVQLIVEKPKPPPPPPPPEQEEQPKPEQHKPEQQKPVERDVPSATYRKRR